MNKENNNVTVFGKMKSMSLEDTSNFINFILSDEHLLDDMLCRSCRESHTCCPCNDSDCIHMHKDVVIWFLEQPYVSVQSMFEEYLKNHNMLDSE